MCAINRSFYHLKIINWCMYNFFMYYSYLPVIVQNDPNMYMYILRAVARLVACQLRKQRSRDRSSRPAHSLEEK